MVEEGVTTPEEDRKRSALSRVGVLTKVLMVALILSIWYQVTATQLIPNTTYTNFTNPITNTTVVQAHTKYGSSDRVPGGNVSGAYAFVQSMLFAIIIILILKEDIKPAEYITLSEAIMIAKKEIKIWQQEELLPRGTIIVTPFSKLRHIVRDSERIPFKYVLDMRIVLQDSSLTKYYRVEVNAKTKYILMVAESFKPLTREDTCGNCGEDSDLKIITADRLKELGTVRRAIAGTQRG